MHYEQVLFEICLFHYEISSQYPCLYCLSWVLVVLIILIWRLLIMFFTKTASSQSDFCQIVVILVCTTKLIFLRNLCMWKYFHDLHYTVIYSLKEPD